MEFENWEFCVVMTADKRSSQPSGLYRTSKIGSFLYSPEDRTADDFVARIEEVFAIFITISRECPWVIFARHDEFFFLVVWLWRSNILCCFFSFRKVIWWGYTFICIKKMLIIYSRTSAIWLDEKLLKGIEWAIRHFLICVQKLYTLKLKPPTDQIESCSPKEKTQPANKSKWYRRRNDFVWCIHDIWIIGQSYHSNRSIGRWWWCELRCQFRVHPCLQFTTDNFLFLFTLFSRPCQCFLKDFACYLSFTSTHIRSVSEWLEYMTKLLCALRFPIPISPF